MKMKLRKILLGASMIMSIATFAQEGANEHECLRMRKIANDAMEAKNYKEAVSYFHKAEVICGNFTTPNYARFTGSLIRVINAETDVATKNLYADSLIQTWNRMDKLGLYDIKDDMNRGYYYLQLASPDLQTADTFFQRGVKDQGTSLKEMFIPLYYYNTYSIFFGEKDAEKKSALKKRLINDYFDLSALITKANFSIKTQETLTTYFNTVVQSCDDLTPEIAGFISNLSTDPEAAKSSLMSLIFLMEEKNCTESNEYMDLINKYLELDPTSPFALEMKAKSLEKDHKYSEANAIYEDLIGLPEVTDERKDELRYKIVYNTYISGAYQSAYNKAMAVKGAARQKCLAIAAQVVAKMASGCGNSTFERNCNYIYAVQLCEQAGSAGSKYISSYKANYPSKTDCFNEGNPASVRLECWGVSVSPCN